MIRESTLINLDTDRAHSLVYAKDQADLIT